MKCFEIKYNNSSELYDLYEDSYVILESVSVEDAEENIKEIAYEEDLCELDYKIIYNL